MSIWRCPACGTLYPNVYRCLKCGTPTKFAAFEAPADTKTVAREDTTGISTASRTAGAVSGEEWFPIQHVGMIPWSLAERAYDVYSAKYGTTQSLQRLAERGGFGLAELGCLLSAPRGRLDSQQELNLCCEVAAREILKALTHPPSVAAVPEETGKPVVAIRE